MKGLLYPGSNTKLVCWFQPWFGNSQHIAIGKDSSNPSVIAAEAQNMIARGCDYVGMDWYGQGSFPDTVVLGWRTYLNSLCSGNVCPLYMFIQEDHNSLTRNGSQQGTLATYETDLRYTFSTYMNQPSYWTLTDTSGCGQRPVLANFGWGATFTSTDWQTVKSFIKSPTGLNVVCTGEPVLIDEGESGLAFNSGRDGAYNWIGVENYDNSNPGITTIQGVSGSGQFNPHFVTGAFGVDHWYSVAQADKAFDVVQIGSVYAGFSDSNANWGFTAPHTQSRINARQCGQVWINSWQRAQVAGYSPTKQLQAIGLVTWNDYEEGTAIESGIDSCWLPSLTISGLSMTITLSPTDITFASLSTIKQMEFYVSADGANLALIDIFPPATSMTVNLANYPQFSVGATFQAFVRIVGLPGIKNVTSPSKPFTR